MTERISTATDRQASENLEMRARQIAGNVAEFLRDCEADIHLAASLSPSSQSLKDFYQSRQEQIWHRVGTPEIPREIREQIPRYASLELVDAQGNQRLVIRGGKILPAKELRNITDPAATEFKSETYFRETIGLKQGAVHISHLTGFHLLKSRQLAGAAEPELAVGGREYEGVVRFSTPLFTRQGTVGGIIVLALDHRHLMEFTQHELPGTVGETVFPSYRSGNYAFMFDDKGWMITHPKFWDIRGVDSDGTLVAPYTARSSKEDVDTGRIPFNLDHAGFIHPNYPVVARMVREHKSGYVDVTNVGGAKKVMAFAPIPYNTGPFARHGIFGGVTIGFQVDQFHEPARAGVAIINEQLREHLLASSAMIAVTALLVGLGAWFLSRSITGPVALITSQARSLASGERGIRVQLDSQDELGELADDFNRMAEELESRNSRLLETLTQLQHSRQEIIEERNFKESVLESISSAILTFSPTGILLSANRNGTALLGSSAVIGTSYREVFSDWHEISKRVGEALNAKKSYGRAPMIHGGNGNQRYFDVGLFPIGADSEQGITVTMRDETEKERMREEITRMDRLASLGKVSAGIAHEVRNPLTGITLLLDDLHDRSGLDRETREMVCRALSEIERVERLITSLLNYASPPKTQLVEADLNMLVHNGLLLFRRSCQKKGVELIELLGDLPLLLVDVNQIQQLLLNLLGNALEELKTGGTIHVSTKLNGEYATMTIADTGRGVPPDDLPLLFDPFFTRKSTGTGLGLSIAQRIVEEHQGSISVSSTIDQGTVFTVSLPCKR